MCQLPLNVSKLVEIKCFYAQVQVGGSPRMIRRQFGTNRATASGTSTTPVRLNLDFLPVGCPKPLSEDFVYIIVCSLIHAVVCKGASSQL